MDDFEQGLSYYTIDQLVIADNFKEVYGRFVGIILKVKQDDRILNFIISDGTGSAEVTFFIKRSLYSKVELPKFGQSIEIIGLGYRKPIGTTKISFVKIEGNCFRVISEEEQFQKMIEALEIKRNRQPPPLESVLEKKQPLISIKRFESNTEQLSLRTLILVYLYYVFEHNTDINSYIFNAQMIRASRDGQEFMKEHNTTKDCLENALGIAIQMMILWGIFHQKVIDEGTKKKKFFVVKRELMIGFEKSFEQKVVENEKKGGVTLQKLTVYVNKKLSEYSNNFHQLFDHKFSQKVLIKLHNANIIYKTSDKIIFPNYKTIR